MGFKDMEYATFTSSDKLTMRYRDLFCDKEGFPNQKAFENFGMSIRDGAEEYHLVCILIDLQKSNVDPDKGYQYGNYVLRHFVVSLMESGFYIFRIQGCKFNIFVEKSMLDKLREILNKENEDYNIYYGIVDEPFGWLKLAEHINIGKELMYQDRNKKIQKIISAQNTASKEKGNTPPELQETRHKKFRDTMWYATVKVRLEEPVFKEVTLYVFPTERKKALETIPVLVVVDDMLNYRLKYGKNIEFGIEGVVITLNARFDREDHLRLVVINTDKQNAKVAIKIDNHEGVCYPASFGKRIGEAKEIYPFKKNASGLYDYIALNQESGEAEINTTGIVEMDGKKYEVQMDETCIDLIKIEK